jgi:hypothetical protein
VHHFGTTSARDNYVPSCMARFADWPNPLPGLGHSWDAVRVSDDEPRGVFPEPDPPDFARLPAGAKELFERRVAGLPVRRIHSRIGAQAIMTNEGKALHRYELQNGLVWSEFAPLATWHMRAVHDRISAVRPGLMPPRRRSGVYASVQTSTPGERIRWRLVRWHVWNPLNGTYTWIRNRAIELRASLLWVSGQSWPPALHP